MKLIDKINSLLEEDAQSGSPNGSPGKFQEDSPKSKQAKKIWYSYEYFPPKTPAGKCTLTNLI